jgi:GntR family transcriptional regulator
MFTINRELNIPLHEQIETGLRELIKHSDYAEGQLLPTEMELADSLEVSRATIRQAISKLVNEGLLIRKKGSGTRVGDKQIEGYGRKWKSFSQEMASLGIEIGNFELHLIKEYAPDYVYDFFSQKEKNRILQLKRLRGDLNEPFVYFISYFNPALNLTGNENFNEPLYGIIKDASGSIASKSLEKIYAINADEILAEKLHVEPNTALLHRVRMVYDQNELPIEYNIGYYRSDKFTYSIYFE